MNIVIVDCFETWEHRVDLLYRVLKKQGHNVTVCISDYCHVEKRKRFDYKEGYIFFSAIPYNKNISVLRIINHICLSKDIFKYIKTNILNDIDLIWVLAPPNIFIRDAVRLKQKSTRVRVIIDIIDLWPETLPVSKIKWLLYPWKRIRNKSLKKADRIVTECNLYQEVLRNELIGKRVDTIYLARENLGRIRSDILPSDTISLCYLGSINNIIDIDCIKSIVEKCKKIAKVELHVIGDGERKNVLLREMESMDIKVIYYGRVYKREEKMEILRKCHFGLNIMKQSVCVGLTMKSIDYFECGLPIINNIKGDTWEIVKRYNCGFNIDAEFDANKLAINSIMMRNNARLFFEEHLTELAFQERVLNVIGE